jgi:hypothetical protein
MVELVDEMDVPAVEEAIFLLEEESAKFPEDCILDVQDILPSLFLQLVQ